MWNNLVKMLKVLVCLRIVLFTLSVQCQDTIVIEYYENNNPAIVETLFPNTDTIKTVSFYQDGSKYILGWTLNNIKVGVWEWYFEDGTLMQQMNVSNSLPNGLSSSWYENGRLESRGVYVEDKENGEWRYWYENGNIRMIINTEDGLNHGYFEKRYSSGAIETVGEYRQGDRSGEWIFYNESGIVVETQKY